jgi:hypothetical protein
LAVTNDKLTIFAALITAVKRFDNVKASGVCTIKYFKAEIKSAVN